MAWYSRIIPGSRQQSTPKIEREKPKASAPIAGAKVQARAEAILDRAMKAHSEYNVKIADWEVKPPDAGRLKKGADVLAAEIEELTLELEAITPNAPDAFAQRQCNVAKGKIQVLKIDAGRLERIQKQISDPPVSKPVVIILPGDSAMGVHGESTRLSKRGVSKIDSASSGEKTLKKGWRSRWFGNKKQEKRADRVHEAVVQTEVRTEGGSASSEGKGWKIFSFLTAWIPSTGAGRDFTPDSAPDTQVDPILETLVDHDAMPPASEPLEREGVDRFPALAQLPKITHPEGEWSFASFEEGVQRLHDEFYQPIMNPDNTAKMQELGEQGHELYAELDRYIKAVSAAGDVDNADVLRAALNEVLMPNKFPGKKGRQVSWDRIRRATQAKKRARGMDASSYVHAMRCYGANQLLRLGRKPSDATEKADLGSLSEAFRNAGQVKGWGDQARSDPVMKAMSQRFNLMALAGPASAADVTEKDLKKRSHAGASLQKNVAKLCDSLQWLEDFSEVEGMDGVLSTDQLALFQQIPEARGRLESVRSKVDECVDQSKLTGNVKERWEAFQAGNLDNVLIEEAIDRLVENRQKGDPTFTIDDVTAADREFAKSSISIEVSNLKAQVYQQALDTEKLRELVSSDEFRGAATLSINLLATLSESRKAFGKAAKRKRAKGLGSPHLISRAGKLAVTGSTLFERASMLTEVLTTYTMDLGNGLTDMAKSYPPGDEKDGIVTSLLAVSGTLSALEEELG